MKICANPNCVHSRVPQPISNFGNCKRFSDGLKTRCKDCEKSYRRTDQFRSKSRERYHKKYKNQFNAIRRAKYQENKEKIRQSSKEYFEKLLVYDTNLRRNLEIYYENNEIQLNKDGIHADLPCKYCGKMYTPKNSEVIRKIKAMNGTGRGESNIYCSDSCKHNCPTYGQVLYPRGFKPTTSREVQPELRKMVLERDNWTCQKCEKGKDTYPELELHCHHINPVVNNPVESADVDNCITLCVECHKWCHQNIPSCKLGDLIKCSKNKTS